MPQTTAKNSWQHNPRLRPPENRPTTHSAGAKLKNIQLEETALVTSQEIVRTQIKRRVSYEWEILETKEEIEDLKSEAKKLPRISGECIKIVTDDRPKPTIVFLRPKSSVYESVAFSSANDDFQSYSSTLFKKPNFQPTKEKIYPRENSLASTSFIRTSKDTFLTTNMSTRQGISRPPSSTVKIQESVLSNFNPTRFNPRKVQSAKAADSRWKRLYDNSNPSDVTIDRRRGLYRPFTAGMYSKLADRQARTKSQLSIILNNRFSSENPIMLDPNSRKESYINAMDIQRRVTDFCEDVEQFKIQYAKDCESYSGVSQEIFYDNSLEILLRKLEVY